MKPLSHSVTPASEKSRPLANRMESAARLVAAIAHDFNNLLTVVQGHAQHLLASSSLDSAQSEELAQIHSATQRAVELTVRLHRFGQKSFVQKAWNLNEVINGVIARLHPHLPPAVELLFESSVHLPGVHCDARSMEQMLSQLIWNGVDAMLPAGGQLRISTRVANIQAEHVRNHPEARVGLFVCLAVNDTGCGMAPEIVGQVFQPFFTTKQTPHRVGLGLARVQGIVKLHCGWVEVDTEVGYGSTFTVFLPAILAEVSRTRATAGQTLKAQLLPRS